MKKPVPKMLEASWETHQRGVLYLNKDWRATSRMPPLLLNPGGQPLRTVEQAPATEYAKRSGYYLDLKGNIVFLLWPKCYHNLDSGEEDFYVVGSFNKWQVTRERAWKLQPVTLDGETAYTVAVSLWKCTLAAKHTFKFITGSNKWLDVPADAPNSVRDESGVVNFQILKERTGYHIFYFQPQNQHRILGEEALVWNDPRRTETCAISAGELLTQLYSDVRLGAYIARGQTIFRLFAPRASSVLLVVSQHPDMSRASTFAMQRLDEMIWEWVHPDDLSGHFYHYHVDGLNRDVFCHFDKHVTVNDPYALALLGRAGPAVIVDLDKLPQPGPTYTPPCWHDLVILETHIRDLLANAPVDIDAADRLGFKGLAKWLRSEPCYLKELGINAVELQPVQEFDSESKDEYHWGYMTCNYFAPESTYASQPEKASQIPEFKECVDAFHENGIAVILDVVYNHVGEPNNLLFIDKKYYFEVNRNGQLENWSGCGNDLKCSAPMVKRLILDSLTHLIKTYDIDGFRFDLAELIGVNVLKDIEKRLKEIKPSIILIAEPWSFRGHIGHALRSTGWSSWNDGYRDFILDYVKGHGNQEGIRYFIAGSPHYFARFPAQTVNYTESHDDRCWLDRLTENAEFDGRLPTQNDRRRTHLMCAILMASIGVPMLAEGQDMLRSKSGHNNTYKRGDLNALNYGRQQDYSNTFQYFCRWIRFRLSAAGALLRLDARPQDTYLRFIQIDNSSAVGVLYNADCSKGAAQLFFAVNPSYSPISLPIADVGLEDFLQIADHERFDQHGLAFALFAIEQGTVHLPGLSCGLWIKNS